MVVFAAVSDKTYCHQKLRVAVKRCGGILAVALFLGLSAAAQAPKESGWVSLFNGKDLTGWKNNGAEKWVVEQGTILCESAANKYGYLTTEKTYRDFNLRLKFKGEAAGNSGVFIRSRISGNQSRTWSGHRRNASGSRSQRGQAYRGAL